MSATLDRFRQRWQRSLSVLRAPRARIELYGGDAAHAAYRAFTARHPRFKVARTKRWGVALLRLPDTFDEYLAGGSREYLRRQRRRAEKAGFRFEIVSSEAHLDDILEINRSAPIRQGRPMREAYVDREKLASAFARYPMIYGVLDSEGRLRAYAATLELGDLSLIPLLLGHADGLDLGLMYYLVSEVIRSCMASRRADGSPLWVMYDTFWGASTGLAYFKDRLGFRPYTVDWIWVEGRHRAPAAQERGAGSVG